MRPMRRRWPSPTVRMLTPEREMRDARTFDESVLVAHVGHEGHETSPLDRFGHCVLADSTASTLAATNDATVAVHQFAEQIHVLVIDVHGPRSLAIDQDRILLFGASLCLAASVARCGTRVTWSRHGECRVSSVAAGRQREFSILTHLAGCCKVPWFGRDRPRQAFTYVGKRTCRWSAVRGVG